MCNGAHITPKQVKKIKKLSKLAAEQGTLREEFVCTVQIRKFIQSLGQIHSTANF
jgi:hypothetical protein